MQLRLGLEGEAEMPEVWAALGEGSRAQVIERLAQVMVNTVVGAGGQGGEGHGEESRETSDEDGAESVPRIA